MANKKKTPQTPKNDGKGRRIGGDDAPTFDWPETDDGSATVEGNIVSIGLAGTKYGNRTRVVLSDAACEGVDVGEERDGVRVVGVWLPERWHPTFNAETQIGDRLSLRRFLKEAKGGATQIAYDIRVL